jgi:UDP-glucose:(heptosyl)LPS alpha-1,3-glucosyltransferase
MTDRLRIAMVALDFHRQGGSELRTGQLVDALLAEGHEVHLLGARIRGTWDARITVRPIQCVPRPRWLEVINFSRRATQLVQEEGFDVVHNQIRPFAPGLVTVGGGCHRFYLREALPLEKGRLVAGSRRVSPLHIALLALERKGFRADRCPYIIANSSLGRDGILRYYPMPPERVVVAYNGVDSTRFSPELCGRYRDELRLALGIGAEDLGVLFVGSGFARKGLGPLLSALARLQDRGCKPHLIVVGGGPVQHWQRHAARLGLGDRVRFAGSVTDPERYYAAADVFALPTFFDPFANATLEAMASGLPVITSRRNGASEILRPGVDGLVVDRPDDVDGLAEALGSLADPVRRRAIGEEARQTALRFPWERPLEKTREVYRAMLSNIAVKESAKRRRLTVSH